MKLAALLCAAASAAPRSWSSVPYDREPFVFDPKGRILQLEYADVAAARGALAVGLIHNNVAILAAAADGASRPEKVSVVDARHGAAFAGLGADGAALVDVARMHAARERLQFSTDAPDAAGIATAVADECHDCAKGGGRRAYGCRFLLAGLGGPGGAACVWSVGPGGDARRHDSGLAAVGGGARDAVDALAGAASAGALGAVAAAADAALRDAPRATVLALAPRRGAPASAAALRWRATVSRGDVVVGGDGAPALAPDVAAACAAALELEDARGGLEDGS